MCSSLAEGRWWLQMLCKYLGNFKLFFCPVFQTMIRGPLRTTPQILPVHCPNHKLLMLEKHLGCLIRAPRGSVHLRGKKAHLHHISTALAYPPAFSHSLTHQPHFPLPAPARSCLFIPLSRRAIIR